MRNIINEISILEGFMNNESVATEIMRAEKEGLSSPAALCYGHPDEWDPDGDEDRR